MPINSPHSHCNIAQHQSSHSKWLLLLSPLHREFLSALQKSSDSLLVPPCLHHNTTYKLISLQTCDLPSSLHTTSISGRSRRELELLTYSTRMSVSCSRRCLSSKPKSLINLWSNSASFNSSCSTQAAERMTNQPYFSLFSLAPLQCPSCSGYSGITRLEVSFMPSS